MPYVTGAQIMTHVGATVNAENTTWAGLCADAIEGAIATRLGGQTPTAGGIDELEVAALTDGAALYNTRDGPSGIVNIGPDGDVIRLGADSLRALRPVLARVHETAGIGIG